MFARSSLDFKALKDQGNTAWDFVAQWVFFNSILCLVAALVFTNMENFWS